MKTKGQPKSTKRDTNIGFCYFLQGLLIFFRPHKEYNNQIFSRFSKKIYLTCKAIFPLPSKHRIKDLTTRLILRVINKHAIFIQETSHVMKFGHIDAYFLYKFAEMASYISL